MCNDKYSQQEINHEVSSQVGHIGSGSQVREVPTADTVNEDIGITEPCQPIMSMPVTGHNECETIYETFNKAVIDEDSDIIGAITEDNRIVLYHGYANPELQDQIEVITCQSSKYEINVKTIRDLHSVIDAVSMRQHLYRMCKLLETYDEKRNELKSAMKAAFVSAGVE